MIVKLDFEEIKTVEEILRRGGDVKIRRFKDGIIISEEVQKVRYKRQSKPITTT